MEVLTNEVELEMTRSDSELKVDVPLMSTTESVDTLMSPLNSTAGLSPSRLRQTPSGGRRLIPSSPSHEDALERQTNEKLKSLGITLDSLLDSTLQERMRVVFSMEDSIRDESTSSYQPTLSPLTSRVVVAKHDDLVIIAIDAADRSGLLLDISKCLSRLQLDLRRK